MFFTSKVLYTAFTVFSIATSAFANPVAVSPELKARQNDVLSSVQSLQSVFTPLVTQLSKFTSLKLLAGFLMNSCYLDQAAAARKDSTAVVNQLQTAFQGTTSVLSSASLAKVNNAAVIDASVTVIAVNKISFFWRTNG